MFHNETGSASSFEDICFSNTLGEFSSMSLPMLGSEFDLDLDELTSPTPDLYATDWDAMVYAESAVPVVQNPLDVASKRHLEFLQLSPPSIQFETLPDPNFASIDHKNPMQASSQQMSQIHSHSQIPVAPRAEAFNRSPHSHRAVVKAMLVSSDPDSKDASRFDVAASNSSQDKTHQDYIVNSLSVSQMIAVATAYDHVCRVEDLDKGYGNWLAASPDANDVEVRAVRALFNPERWNIAKDIVMRIVKIVDDLRSAVIDTSSVGPANTGRASKHTISKHKKRLSPKLIMKPATIAMDIHPFMDESGKKRRT